MPAQLTQICTCNGSKEAVDVVSAECWLFAAICYYLFLASNSNNLKVSLLLQITEL